MIESTTREIDGVTFKFTPMMATKARELLDQLLQRFGTPFGKALEALDQADKLTLDADTANPVAMVGQMAAPVGVALAELTGKLDPKFHADLVKTLARQTMVVGDGGEEVPLTTDIEIRFATKLMTEAKWIWFCLECQYADFLGLFQSTALQAVAAKAMANTPASKSPME